jgi:parallel beta-helix repeat protein
VGNNTIVDNGEAAISLTLFCYYNNITGNKLVNGSTGLNFYTSTGHNFVRGNTITGTTGKGIFLWVDSDANAFYYNTVANSTDYGLYLDNSCEKNVVICNYFLDNKVGDPQAFDDGPTNTFELNHWNDWISPDADADGIVDVPYDLAGAASNQDPFPQVHPYDVIAPVISLASPPNNAFVSPTTPIQLRITDNYPLIPVTVWYSWDGGANSASLGPYVIYAPPTEMQHMVQVWAEDAGGNQATPKVFTFRVDATPPTIALASATQPTLGQSSAQIQFTITDVHPIITALYKWGNATTNSTLLAPSYTVNFSSIEGPQTLYVFAEDEVGNWGTYTGTFATDNTAPTAQIAGLADLLEVSGNVSVTVTPQDANGIEQVEFWVEGNLSKTDTAAPYAWLWDSTMVADGDRIITIRVVDRAGNVLKQSFTVIVANEPEESDGFLDDLLGDTGLSEEIIILAGGIIVVSVGGGTAGFIIIRRRRRG